MAINLSLFIDDVKKVSQETGVPVSVTLAQLILESTGNYANGLSLLGAQYKNLFGVKGTGPGGTVSLPTTEVINGQYVQTKANFRVYNSYYESILDHAKVLQQSNYTQYTNNAKTITEYVQGVAKGGYATDVNYASKLLNVINSYGLTKYDTGAVKKVGANGYTLENEAHTGSDDVSINYSSEEQEAINEEESKNGFTEKLFFNVVRTISIIGLAGLMVLFFLKAFPVVESVANVTPVGKAIKTVKGGKK